MKISKNDHYDYQGFYKIADEIRDELRKSIIVAHRKWKSRSIVDQCVDFSLLKIMIHDEITQQGFLEVCCQPNYDVNIPGSSPPRLVPIPIIKTAYPGDFIDDYDGILISIEDGCCGKYLHAETNAKTYYIEVSLLHKKYRNWIHSNVRFSLS